MACVLLRGLEANVREWNLVLKICAPSEIKDKNVF